MSKDMEDVTQSGSADIEAEEDSSETHCLGEQKESSHGGGSQVDSSPTLCEDEQLPTEQHVRLINKDLILPPHFSSGVFVTQSDGEALPICTPPQLSRTDLTPVAHSSFPLCLSNGHGHEKKRLHSTSTQKSQHSLKSTASQIQQVAGNDCCVHCILACLFCELVSFCSVLIQCLACGGGCGGTCCCSAALKAGGVCGGSETGCPTTFECGMLEECCESSDCLEICLDCCSICFPA
ncbi:myoD family inhibitor domain-containing protein-like isoform X2 [Polypterus senegalus]